MVSKKALLFLVVTSPFSKVLQRGCGRADYCPANIHFLPSNPMVRVSILPFPIDVGFKCVICFGQWCVSRSDDIQHINLDLRGIACIPSLLWELLSAAMKRKCPQVAVSSSA